MRFTSPSTSRLMRTASIGPAGLVARAEMIRRINLGLPQNSFVASDAMRRGGSMGAQSNRNVALGCLCGPGDPGFFGDVAPPVVIIGPVASRIIQMRQAGTSPKMAMLDALARLHLNGVTHITPEIHMQIAAGLQPLPVGLYNYAKQNLNGLGALGLAPVIGAGVTGASVGASAIGGAAAAGLGIGAGLALGQTLIPIPVVGAVIGAAIFEAVHLMQRHVGKAEASWTAPGFYASLQKMNGRDYEERSFSEAFKGMMDTGNNIIPGCGADRHKDPDCFNGPLANVIAQGYLSGVIPLSATTADVMKLAVIPWLQSGAGGIVNWNTLKNEPTQMLMIQASADRYLAGQPMTRGDMPSYGNTGAHTPSLLQALQPLIAKMTPTTTTPNPAGAPATSQTGYIQPISSAPPPPDNSGAANLPVTISPSQPPTVTPSGGGMIYSSPSGGGAAIGYDPLTQGGAALPTATQAGIGGGLPSWAMLAIAVVGLGFVFFKQGPVTEAPKV